MTTRPPAAPVGRKPKREPKPRCYTFTMSSQDGGVEYVRVHGRYPKTKADRDALEDIIRAAQEMLRSKRP
jgi:hypothetical protein